MSDRHVRRLRRTTAGTLAMIALASAPAAARPALDPPQAPGGTPRAQVVVHTTRGGFEWGSALIGAGTATAVWLLGAAGATTASRRHRRAHTASASAA